MSRTVEKSGTRVALITGAARRIGASIAQTLHRRGCDVILHYHHSKAEVTDLQAQFNALRADSATLVSADLCSEAAIQRLATAVRQQTRQLDLLVNNASRFFPTTVGETTPQQWLELMGSNLQGPYFLTQALLPELTAAGGCVINLLDVHASRPMRGHAVYCMAKAGLQMMTLALARDLAPDIRVNGVAPGAILWPEQGCTPRQQEKIIENTSLGRVGEPADIASAVAYLGLDATYITGQVLAVDGGRSLNI